MRALAAWRHRRPWIMMFRAPRRPRTAAARRATKPATATRWDQQAEGTGSVTLPIGVDVGGTKVAGGVVDEHGAVLASNRRDTPAEDPAGTRDTIAGGAA